MPKASLIIPNWNGAHLLSACLQSINEQTFRDFEVIVVDNGSLDNSLEVIKKVLPKTKVIALPENVGFSPAVNKGIKAAQGKYIVLINNDAKLDKNCLNFLIQAADLHEEVGFVAAKMLNFFDKTVIDSAGDYIDAVGHANNIGFGEKDGPKFSKEGSLFLATGGGSLFKKEVFEKVGLLDEDYFAYFEDVDLCLRAQLQGYKGWFEPKAVIFHIHKATSGKNKPFLEYLQFRNMAATIIKDFPKALLFKDLNWLKILLVNLNTIRFLASQGHLLPALQAEWYILRNLFKLLRQRKEIQAKKTVSDNYIIENIVPKKVTLFGLLRPGF